MNGSYLKLSVVFLLISCSIDNSKRKQGKESIQISEINSLILQSESKSNDVFKRFSYAKKAKELSEKNEIDSLIAKSLFQLVKLSYPLKDKDSFLNYYPRSLSFARKIKDTAYIAQTHNYAAYFFQKHNLIDSSYYHFYQGSKYFKLKKNDYQTGKMLLNMAIIQKNKRDYKGSEEITKKALEYLIKTDKKRFIASAYNNLGITNNNQNKFSVALKYHNRALKIRKELKKIPILIVESLNNILVTYKNKEDYNLAFAYYDSIQPYQHLLEKHPIVKARVVDNLAHAKLLSGETENVLEDMEKALSIRRQENHLSGIMVSLLHLSEYYRVLNKPELSFKYALEAKNLSGEYENLRDVLKALRILTLNKFGKEDTSFIKEYYSVIDEIEKAENSVADSFARIRLEVDEKDQIIQRKNTELKRKKYINLITLLILLFTVVYVALTFIYKQTKRKRLEKELNDGFDTHLTKKYQLTYSNLEFWKIWITKDSLKEAADELFIGYEAAKSRRTSLRDKVNKIEKTEGNFTQSKAIIIYNKEFNFFKNNMKSQV